MSIIIGPDGLKVKKLFASKEVPFSDMERIDKDGSKFIFKCKDGETLTYTAGMADEERYRYVINAVKKYNIEYENINETKDHPKLYYMEEIEPLIERAGEIVRSVALPLIRENKGPEFGLDLELHESEDFVSLYFFLTKNGQKIEVPGELKYEEDEEYPLSFDNLVVAFLAKWESSKYAGQYGVSNEMEDEDLCRKTVKDFIGHSLDLWKGHTF